MVLTAGGVYNEKLLKTICRGSCENSVKIVFGGGGLGGYRQN